MKRWLGWPSVVAAIFAAVVAAAIHFQVASQRDREREKRDFLRQEVAKLEIEIEEIKQLTPMIVEFLGRKQVSEALRRDRPQPIRLLNELTRRRPEGVRFVSVTFVRERVRVEGVAVSEQALRNFVAAVTTSAVLQAPEGLTTQGREFSFQVALRAAGGA